MRRFLKLCLNPWLFFKSNLSIWSLWPIFLQSLEFSSKQDLRLCEINFIWCTCYHWQTHILSLFLLVVDQSLTSFSCSQFDSPSEPSAVHGHWWGYWALELWIESLSYKTPFLKVSNKPLQGWWYESQVFFLSLTCFKWKHFLSWQVKGQKHSGYSPFSNLLYLKAFSFLTSEGTKTGF
jgi:hypothetical protein